MSRFAVSCIELMIKLIQQEFPGVKVIPYTDVDDALNLPLMVVECRNGQMVSGHAIAWDWDVEVAVVTEDMEECDTLSDELYGAMHGFEDNGANIPGVGMVSGVDDKSMPHRVAVSKTAAGDLTQYSGSWSVRVRF